MRNNKSQKKISPVTLPAQNSPSKHWQVLGCVLFIIVTTLIAYSGTFKNGFVHFDDTIYITENIHIKQGLTPSAVVWAFKAFHASNWHPLTWLSHMADVTFFGFAPAGHHAVSLIIHILTALLLFGFLRRVTGSLLAASFVAALFALHPLHVESVAWASERKDVLSAFFFFATLFAYSRYTKKPGIMRYGAVFALFAMGLLAKPMLVTLPIILHLLDFWPLSRFTNGIKSLPRLFFEKLPLFALVIASIVLTIIAQKEAIITFDRISFIDRLINSIVSCGVYLWQMLFPFGLAVFYPFPKTPQILWAIITLCLLIVLTIIVLRNAKRHPYLVTGWFWYLITLIPVIGIMQVGAQAHADRYTYIPLTGIFILIVWGIKPAILRLSIGKKRLLAAVAVILILLLAGKTYQQVRTWKNDESLFSNAQNVTKNNYVALNNLGILYDMQGKTDKAIDLFTQALKIKPDFVEPMNNVGDIFRRTGRGDQAIMLYRKALAINPKLAITHSNLGMELAAAGKTDEAKAHYLKAIVLDSNYAFAYYNFGNLLAENGQYNEAASNFKKACALAPDSCECHNNYGLMLARLGRIDEAIAEYHKAISLKPDYADAYNNLGILFTVIGRMDDAIVAYRKSLELNPKNGSCYNNLGYVLIRSGKLLEASDLLEKAQELIPGDFRIITNLADVTHKQGNTKKTLQLLTKALGLAQSAGDTQQVAAISEKIKAFRK